MKTAAKTAKDTRTCPCCSTEISDLAELRGIDRLLGTSGEFEVAVCPNCGTGTTFPKVRESDLAEYYAGEYVPTEEWRPNRFLALLSRAVNALIRRRLLKTKPLSALATETGSLLDVGCGRGELGALLVERGWRVTGIEPSPAGIRSSEQAGLTVWQGTLSSVTPGERDFDVVNFRHSLEHVVDPAQDLSIAAGLCRPGGKVIVEVPNFGSRQRQSFGTNWFHLDLPRHRTHFTRDGLAGLMESCGLKVLETGTKSSAVGLGGSLYYRLAGRWPHSGALSTRLVGAACSMLAPLGYMYDQIAGPGKADVLYAVAERPR